MGYKCWCPFRTFGLSGVGLVLRSGSVTTLDLAAARASTRRLTNSAFSKMYLQS
jgi:hypothetical protein